MKQIYYFLLIMLLPLQKCFCQQIISSSGTKSGILVGSDRNFAGIGFENASDKFSFNYKTARQTYGSGVEYTPTWGVNVATDIILDKSKSAFVSSGKWQGGVSFDGTIFKTHVTRISDTEGTQETEVFADGHTVTHKRAKYIQTFTYYLRVSDGLSRVNTMETASIKADTTFATLTGPLQNVLTFTPGFFMLHQWKSKFFLSWGLSMNIGINNHSTTALTEVELLPTTEVLLNSKDSTVLQQVGKQKSYFSGKTEKEQTVIPRADIFIRLRKDTQVPVIGMAVAYSPILSSLKEVRTRHCIAFGPTFGLPSFPDQVVFAILNEFNQDKEGVFRYSLNLQAVLPIKLN